ncbi:MAG: hypothetical protein LBR75_02735, partial [Prevotellaceae bacterium]|nr:hypothetical protein [Prevotellaceae bacterium]
FNTLISWNYNHWNVNAWHRPQHEICLSGNYKITDKINLSASGYVATVREIPFEKYDYYDTKIEIINLDPIIDFSLGATYKINNSFTAFLQANNIFATKYHIWYGYNAQRFNAMAGLTYSF